eukprot:m.143092 g.143092  ORF g.143092 m.143092 type:complete len:83 (+) comp10046_c1_seq1:1361-1609(+)
MLRRTNLVLCLTRFTTVQARHSYTVNDIVWDHVFEQCIFERPEGGCVVDFNRIHNTIPISSLPYGNRPPSPRPAARAERTSA